MAAYRRGAALLICLPAHDKRAKRSILSSISLFIIFHFVFAPSVINGWKKKGKNVLEILMAFTCRNGNPSGIDIWMWPMKYPRSLFMYSHSPVVFVWMMVQAFLPRVLVLQLLYLMDAVQNGIRQQNLRFTFSLTLYIARVAQQMLKPGTVICCACWTWGMLKRREWMCME